MDMPVEAILSLGDVHFLQPWHKLLKWNQQHRCCCSAAKRHKTVLHLGQKLLLVGMKREPEPALLPARIRSGHCAYQPCCPICGRIRDTSAFDESAVQRLLHACDTRFVEGGRDEFW